MESEGECEVPGVPANSKCNVCHGDCTSHHCISCKKLCHPFCGKPIDEGYGGGVICDNCLGKEEKINTVKNFPPETLHQMPGSGRKRLCQSDDEQEEGNNEKVFFF